MSWLSDASPRAQKALGDKVFYTGVYAEVTLSASSSVVLTGTGHKIKKWAKASEMAPLKAKSKLQGRRDTALP